MYPSEKVGIFTPQNFDDYVGQERPKAIARLMISASQIEARSLPNILIDGPYGTGKTSLAKIIFQSAGITPRVMDAAAFKGTPFIKHPLIIDEVHNLDSVVADSLNLLIDRGSVQLIACTTSPGQVPAAFKSRFREIHLEPYNLNEIEKILANAVARKNLTMADKTIAEIARRSRLNPRAAIHNLSFIFDWMIVNNNFVPTQKNLEDAFSILGIDKNGLTERDYKYLAALDTDRSVGLSHLSAMLGLDTKTIEREVEPYLLQLGLVGRMPRGRILLKDL
jgi:Holliday junction DNA helicase RuvB